MQEAQAMTLFFAVPLPAGPQALAGRCRDTARAALGPARYAALEGLHITLAFLGRVAADQVPGLVQLAARAAGRSPGFELRTAGLGGFPGPGRTRILWLGCAPEPALDALAANLRQALAAGGVAFDAKPFRPHITLARFRQPVDLDVLPSLQPEPAVFPVRGLSLLESVPTPAGMHYRAVAAVPLATPGTR
jgi:2'-5' RNA ligase